MVVVVVVVGGGYRHQGNKRISLLIHAMGQRSVWSHHPHTELQLGVTHVHIVHQLNKPEGSFPNAVLLKDGEDRGENRQVVTSQ